MTRTSVDLVADVGLAGNDLNGKTDVTKALVGGTTSADGLCRQYGVKRVTMPDNCKLLVSTQAAGSSVVLNPQYARDWVGTMGDVGVDNGTQIVLGMVTPTQWTSQVVTIFNYNGWTNGLLSFRINGQAAKEMSASGPLGAKPDHDSSGNLQGFACHGMRSDNCVNPEMHVSVINTRTINTAGHAVSGSYTKASAFALETVNVKGGNFWVEFDTQDGSIGSECLVMHGVKNSTVWYVRSLRSQRMFRGWGCFSGGFGEVHDLVVQNLYTLAAANMPGGKILAKAINIESGAGPTHPDVLPTQVVKLYAPQSTNSPEFLTVNNNDSTHTVRVELHGLDNTGKGVPGAKGFSKNDGNCINFAGSGPCDDGVYVTDFFFNAPDKAIVNGTNAQGACVSMVNCTYTPSGTTKASGGASASNGRAATGSTQGGVAWDLTVGAGPSNTAPSLSHMVPADGSTVTAGGTVTVSCDATDDNDSPTSGLTAVGQAYLPKVATTSVVVAGGTATVTATAHRATNGGQVRMAGLTPSALNGIKTVTSVADADHFTYASASTTATVQGTVEPLGSAITMTTKTNGLGFTGSWAAPASINQTRTLELTVTDSGSLSTTLPAAVVTSTTNNPPLVAVVPPLLGKMNPATGQTLAAIVIDPNAGDTISSAAWVLKDSTNATVLSGSLSSATPDVSTTTAGTIADVTQLSGDAGDHVTLTSTAGASSTGGVVAIAHGLTSLVVIQYAGVSGNQLVACTCLSGTGALSPGDTVRSANYNSATFDASTLTPGATYFAQANATDNHSALGSSAAIPVLINVPPVVTWNVPTAGQTFGGTITVSVSAQDDGGTSTGELYNRDTGSSVLIGAFTQQPDGSWTYPLDTTTLTNLADHTLRASITDALGLAGYADITFHVNQSQTDTTAPTISDISFSDGTVLAVPTDLVAYVADNAGVASVFVRIDLGGGQSLDLPMQLPPT